jgi:hypothetical protein
VGTPDRTVSYIVKRRAMPPAAAVVVNAGRLNFDGKLDLTKLANVCNGALTAHDEATPSPEAIASRSENHSIVISKEVPVAVNLLPVGPGYIVPHDC